MQNLGWTKADREADQLRHEQRKSEEEQQRAAQSSKDALAGVGVLAIAVAVVALLVLGVVFTFKALSGGGVDGDALTRTLDREIAKAGEYGFASYANYLGVTDEGSGDVAIQTSLFDKPENEQTARYMCSSMMTIRLQDGLEELGRVRVLSSAATTLAYCT